MLASRVHAKVIRFHDAQHTYASLILKQGIHPKTAHEKLGHASAPITLDIYCHLAPGLQQAAANHFDEVLNPKYNGKVSPKALVANFPYANLKN
jgi:integrase